MDETLASAAAKLATTEHPIAVHRHKHLIHGLKDEAARLERVLTQGDEIVAQSALKLPAFFPAWLQRLIRWAARPLLRARLQQRAVAPELIRAQLQDLKQRTATATNDVLRGILTPLTVSDDAECHAYYFKTRRHLEASLPEEITEDGQRARAEAIEFTTNAYLLAKRVECALKKAEERNGRLALVEPVTRALTNKEAHALDPRLTAEIWTEYRQAFELSEDELGKSQAPRPASSASSAS
jgi:hypothetical protein